MTNTKIIIFQDQYIENCSIKNVTTNSNFQLEPGRAAIPVQISAAKTAII
jgi:hypothetical protein